MTFRVKIKKEIKPLYNSSKILIFVLFRQLLKVIKILILYVIQTTPENTKNTYFLCYSDIPLQYWVLFATVGKMRQNKREKTTLPNLRIYAQFRQLKMTH